MPQSPGPEWRKKWSTLDVAQANNLLDGIGLAKKESFAYMKRDNLAPPTGGLWGTRSECIPIASARHHAKVVQYILDHAKKGAAVWELDPWDVFDPSALLLE